MPLVVFAGISSIGAVFLIVFIAQLCRDERHGACRQGAQQVRSTIPLVVRTATEEIRPGRKIMGRQATERTNGTCGYSN